MSSSYRRELQVTIYYLTDHLVPFLVFLTIPNSADASLVPYSLNAR